MASGIVEQPSSSQTTETQQQPTGGGARSQLVQRLLMADNLPAFLHDLLEQQAAMVAGTEAAGFIIEHTSEGPALRPSTTFAGIAAIRKPGPRPSRPSPI